MSLRRLAIRRDANEGPIVDALLAAGATVLRLNMKDVPDLLVGFRGRNVLMEIKNPPGPKGGTSADGQHLSFDQHAWHLAWRGLTPVVVRTPAEALRAIGIAVEEVT